MQHSINTRSHYFATHSPYHPLIDEFELLIIVYILFILLLLYTYYIGSGELMFLTVA